MPGGRGGTGLEAEEGSCVASWIMWRVSRKGRGRESSSHSGRVLKEAYWDNIPVRRGEGEGRAAMWDCRRAWKMVRPWEGY